MLRWLTRSVLVRVILFIIVLMIIEHHGRPWAFGWMRLDEAAEVAETYLSQQGVDASKYTLIRAVEHRPDGIWSPREGEVRFGTNPAIGYVLRYFRMNAEDGWTIGVSPIGRIYRIRRQQLDDEPARRLGPSEAFLLVHGKLREDLHVPADSVAVLDDSLVTQPQRSDWYYTLQWPSALDSAGNMVVKLAGEAITYLAYNPVIRQTGLAPNSTPEDRRVLAVILILIGVFLVMHYHRTPLAIRAAGMWGAVMFFLTLAVRGLTFPQSVILMPADSSITGYLSRVSLAAVIEAIQSAILLGLVVATGESLSRDVFRRSTSLSRLAPGLSGWRAAWARAARWALPAAALVLAYEAIAAHYWGPIGLSGKVPMIMANALSSPLPKLALPAQVGMSVLWEESVYRLWLFTLLLFWLRVPLLAIPLTAAVATYFAGYDLSQFASAGALLYIAWGMVASALILRVGIISAMLFHALVLGGYTSVAMMWTGFGQDLGYVTIGSALLLILLIARSDPPPAPAPAAG
ncbi:MAG: hypothetical protein ACOZB3_02460 [Calditrichota bacterium]